MVSLCSPVCQENHRTVSPGLEILILVPQAPGTGISGLSHHTWLQSCSNPHTLLIWQLCWSLLPGLLKRPGPVIDAGTRSLCWRRLLVRFKYKPMAGLRDCRRENCSSWRESWSDETSSTEQERAAKATDVPASQHCPPSWDREGLSGLSTEVASHACSQSEVTMLHTLRIPPSCSLGRSGLYLSLLSMTPSG